MLTNNEQRVYDLITEDPFLTQQELSDRLAINRSTIASLISSLTQKKYLKGRAYVVNQPAHILCIGAMNVDRKYSLYEALVPGTSNPVASSLTIGGVARNIAENLGRLGESVSLLSIAGRDQDYEWIKERSASYINFDLVSQSCQAHTGSYSALIDDTGEMQFAFADMSVYDEMNLAWIQSYETILKEARMIILDLNVPMEAVEYVIRLAQVNQIELVIIPVSGPKMKRLPKDLRGVTWMIVNQDESEAFFDRQVKTQGDFDNLAQAWLATGVSQVIMTRGVRPSLYVNQAGDCYEQTPPTVDKVVDVTGAGDSYASGLIYGHLQGYPAQDCIQLAMTNAYHTIQSAQTVRPELTEEQLAKEYQQLKESGKL